VESNYIDFDVENNEKNIEKKTSIDALTPSSTKEENVIEDKVKFVTEEEITQTDSKKSKSNNNKNVNSSISSKNNNTTTTATSGLIALENEVFVGVFNDGGEQLVVKSNLAIDGGFFYFFIFILFLLVV
jgi:hypothetical protein